MLSQLLVSELELSMSSRNCFVLVSDAGESWALEGDQANANETLNDSGTNALLPKLLADGWSVVSTTAGSGAKDDSSYWLVLLTKAE